jgi:acetyl esterase/lipase
MLLVAAAGCGGDDGAESATTVTAVAVTTEAPASITVQTIEGVSYTVEDDNLLDVTAPEEPGPWPVVIIAHGGYGSRSGFRDLADAVATEGAVVFNISYDDVFPPISGIEDIACAVRFARAKAADHGGDPARITLIGTSQGAVSGMVIGLNGDAYTGDCITPEGSALVDAVVGYEGGYDWAEFLFGELREEDPDLWEAIDPYSHIGGNPDLVVRLIHGEGGESLTEVPRIVSVEFHQALADAGYDVELTLVDERLHLALTARGTEAFAIAVQQAMEVAAR